MVQGIVHASHPRVLARPLLKIHHTSFLFLLFFLFVCLSVWSFYCFFFLFNTAMNGIYASTCIQLYLITVGGISSYELRSWVYHLMSQFASGLVILGTEWVCSLIVHKSLDLNPCWKAGSQLCLKYVGLVILFSVEVKYLLVICENNNRKFVLHV